MSAPTKFRFAAMSRRAAITGATLAAMALAACNSGGATGAAEGDMALGAGEDAKVTVVEYASVTCVACADWSKRVWPEFKAKYIDNDKIRFVLREYPTPPADVAAAGFLLGRCAAAKSGNPEDYFKVVDEMWANHPGLTPGGPQFPAQLAQARLQPGDVRGFLRTIEHRRDRPGTSFSRGLVLESSSDGRPRPP